MKIRNPKSEIRKKSEARSPKANPGRGCFFGLRNSGFLRILDFGFRISLLLLSASALAQSTNKIPDLKPPLPELPPTFWEQHGWTLAATVVALLGAVALLIWRLGRPQPAIATAPSVLARQALEALRGRAEDESLVRQVSRALRRYVVAAFALAQEEPTAEEVIAALNGARRVSAELADALADFLRDCDARKFAPVPPPRRPDLVARALDLVARCESELRPAPAPAPAPTAEAVP